jgi:dTDP-4-amino-4,6-dideoxygalactose transaminase
VQTSVLYPAIHEFSAYAGEAHAPLPQSEFVARAEVTLPLYPDLAEADQDRVIVAFRETLAELASSDAGQAAGA